MAEGLIIRKDDRNISVIGALVIIGLLFLLLFVITYSIPDPPLKEVPVMAETELQEIDLQKYVVQVGKGGGGSGSPTEAPVTNKVVPQTEKVITSNKATTTVKTGQSNHTNTTKPSENTASTTQSTPNYFGSGGTGDGNTGGTGKGLGSDNGVGDGDGNGPGEGGTVRRFLIAKPNTTNINSDENCKVVLRVLIDEDGTIVGKPQFVKGASTTNNMMLINQVVYVVQSEAKFNKAKGTKLMTQVITIDILAN